MTNNQAWRRARKESGLARFERTTRRLTQAKNGRRRLAYRVLGTAEAGQQATLGRLAGDIFNKLLSLVPPSLLSPEA